jgi:bacteriocin-like protein
MNLSEQELNNIEGGAILLGIGKWIISGGIVTFIIGTINGILRPLTCTSDK